jgi:hypothetical protein
MTSLITRSADHRYTYLGNTYPGVTGILKVLDKSDALMAWAARNTAEAAIALASRKVHDPFDVESLQSALDELLKSVGPEGTVKALTSRSSWKRDEAAQLGTDVHKYADDHVNGRPLPELPALTQKYVSAYEDWWMASGWTIRTTEAFILNESIGYGGTLDLLCRDRDGRTVLSDIKTGRSVYPEAVLQLAAYGMAEKIQTPEGKLFNMPKPDRYSILHVTGDGVREIEIAITSLEMSAFVSCVDLALWRETMKGKRL